MHLTNAGTHSRSNLNGADRKLGTAEQYKPVPVTLVRLAKMRQVSAVVGAARNTQAAIWLDFLP
jgi:hypothetical protein